MHKNLGDIYFSENASSSKRSLQKIPNKELSTLKVVRIESRSKQNIQYNWRYSFQIEKAIGGIYVETPTNKQFPIFAQTSTFYALFIDPYMHVSFVLVGRRNHTSV
jgi:hypothetical protein